MRYLPGLLLLAALSRTASATVSPDEGEATPPTLVVLQHGDPLLAEGRARPGDFRLEYGTVAFLIGQPGPVAPPRAPEAAGAVVDVLQLFPQSRRLGLAQITTYLNATPGRQAVYSRVTTSRTPDLATVQVEGYDSDDPGVAVVTQYQVGPQLKMGEALRIITTVRNAGQRPLRHYQIGDSIRWGGPNGGLERFLPGPGFLPLPGDKQVGPVPYLLGLGPAGSVVYLPVGPGAHVTTIPGWRQTDASGAMADLPPGGSLTFVRSLQVAAEPRRLLCAGRVPVVGSTPVVGTVREAGGDPLRARVVIEQPEGGGLIAGPTDAEGRFALCVPRPGRYRVRAESPGRQQEAPAAPVNLGGEGEVAVTLSRPARLAVSLREVPVGHHGTRPSPGRVNLVPLSGGPLRPSAVGAGSPATVVLDGLAGPSALGPAGDVDLLVPPGRYRVVASHGPFYDLTSQEVTLRAGESRRSTLVLRRALPAADVQGVRCAALRVVSDPPLAPLLGRAEGLDVMLAGETPAFRATGDVAVVPGAELLTARYGRLTIYPLRDVSGLPDPRRLPTRDALLLGLRRLAEEGAGKIAPPVIQIAPPPGPAAGIEAGVNAWEVMSGDRTFAVPAALSDFLAQVDGGARLAAVGGADPRLDDELSVPRTCYREVESVQPLSRGDELRASVRQRDLVVTNGPWLRVNANGAGPGELAAAPDGKVTVSITAMAAPWIDLRELSVWVGPKRVATLKVPPSTAPLRYQGATSITIDRDAAIVVLATGERPMDPVRPGARPLALSNPVFVDRDGDGRFGPAIPKAKPAPPPKRRS